jgi:PAS domain S-box-containing protein
MARKRQSGQEPRLRWEIQPLQIGLALAVQVIVSGLLAVVVSQHSTPAGLLYGLLALALLGLALQVAGFFLWQRSRDTPSLDQYLCRTLSETADSATAVFRTVCLLQQALAVERVALLATDGDGRHAELLSEVHTSECEGAWAGRVALERLPVLADALKTGQPAFWPELSPLHLPPESAQLLTAGLPALSIHPLLGGNALVGFLALATAHPRRLARLYRRPTIEAATYELGMYIRTAGLQPDVLRAQDQIELLYEITTHLNTNLSLEKVMSNVLSQAMARVGATRGSIFLLDEHGQVADRILGRENLAPEVSSLVIRGVMERGLAAWVMAHKEGTVVRDVMEDGRWMILPDHAGHVRSAVAVPFLRQGKVQGMLFLTHPEVAHFRQEHLDLLMSIANQAAIAIQNARLYEWAENERRTLAAVLDSSADAVLVTDREGRILLANPAAHQALGVEDRPAPLGEVLFHADLLTFLQEAATREGTVSENVRLSDGRTFSVSVAPVRDREGQTIGRVAVMHDITHLIELDEMKSRFVSTVSHDLKAPLTAIRGFADLIKVVGPLSEDQSQFIARIREVVEGMTRLISSLLDLGRIEAGLGIEVQEVNLRDVLVTAKYDLAMPAQEKDILVEVEVPANLPPIQGDPYRLQQVLSNYLGNAIKYTPRGGHVWVRAETHPKEIVVSVTDTGIGIPPADLPHVFEKFYRVQDSRVADQEGSGLGLAIVKSIISEHRGKVWTESTLGRGSTFYFSLPL